MNNSKPDARYAIALSGNTDLTEYDGTEVAQCCDDGESVERIDAGDVHEPIPGAFYMWTVYLHRKDGGVESIADLPTAKAAYMLAGALDVCLAAIEFEANRGGSPV